MSATSSSTVSSPTVTLASCKYWASLAASSAPMRDSSLSNFSTRSKASMSLFRMDTNSAGVESCASGTPAAGTGSALGLKPAIAASTGQVC